MPGKPTYGDLQRKIAELEARLRLAEIADRERAEDAGHKERRRLEAVLESITDGLLVLAGDWRYTYVSETGARMIGMRREELIGGCVWELFPHAKGTKFYEGYHQAVATGQPVHFEEFYPEPLNQWLECHCYPGEEGLAVYFQDISGRKLAEEALRQSEERFRIAQELSPDGFTILRPVRDEQGHIIDFQWIYENAAIARLHGTDPNGVVGRRLSEILPGHRQSPFHEIFQRVAETGEAGILEAPYQGDSIPALTWFRTAVVAMGDDIAVFAQDITVRKQIETTLRESEERLTALVQNAPVGIVIHGPDGRLVRSNPEARRLLGVAETEAIGKCSRIRRGNFCARMERSCRSKSIPPHGYWRDRRPSKAWFSAFNAAIRRTWFGFWPMACPAWRMTAVWPKSSLPLPIFPTASGPRRRCGRQTPPWSAK